VPIHEDEINDKRQQCSKEVYLGCRQRHLRAITLMPGFINAEQISD